jgi:hypothetical protein
VWANKLQGSKTLAMGKGEEEKRGESWERESLLEDVSGEKGEWRKSEVEERAKPSYCVSRNPGRVKVVKVGGRRRDGRKEKVGVKVGEDRNMFGTKDIVEEEDS